MTVRLRPHHLLCLLTYVGKGYSAGFVENYDRIAARLAAGEEIVVVDGPDDICAPLLSEPEPHCHRQSVVERDVKASADVGRLLDIPIVPGTAITLDPTLLDRMRSAFTSGQTRAACVGCEWSDLCKEIASGGYGATRILPPSA